METAAPVLSLKKISKSFSGITVLHDVDIDLYPGEVHGVVGENGAGKSTLIKIMSGAYQPDHGTIHYQGQLLKNITPRWARENGINTIYQEIDLIPSLTAAENIALGNEPLGKGGSIDWAAVRSQARRILDDMGAHLPIDVAVGNLKVAHQQMVAIAKALSLNSQVLILDEPTAVFTSSEIELLFNIIRRLKAQGIAILYISHHLDEIFQIGDRVTVLRDGYLVRSGLIAEFDKPSLVRAMVGREIDFSLRNGHSLLGEEILRVKNLSRSPVVEDINFVLRRGEIVGVAGLVGAGRTEMARLLVGADPLQHGEIYLNGRRIRPTSPMVALGLGIGMLPESRKEEGLVLQRSMAENMAYSLVQKSSRAGVVPWKSIRREVASLLSKLEVRPANPNLQVTYMSGGNQQKVVLGKLLAAKCDVLILDEPTRGVDVGARLEIYKLMYEMKTEGKAILMISSDLPEILTQADRILVMAKGRIVAEVPAAEASEEKILAFALRLESEMV
ncbi:MAG: sugar ABC transporter ATP-binding protein [Anaerolineae bacterium]|nr:sugar ABC transporter ATP-binding protein [Anaerolineae bacterium]